ncbi:hypothetical protein EKN06_12840 [Croceicoccus ponticola]|uniref:Uncharacterized protein n=1 Tax=Croceicoccus ponticola TaxID=2217664 RepID=A0A437GVI2_9SPHN|nr:hypothetical protein EKN06_12840 [Croceicoccus ponticola]
MAQSLHNWAQTPSTWQKAKCKKRTVVELSVLPNATMKIRMGEQVWLALTSAQQDSWVPYSWVSQDQGNIEIHVPETKVMKCRVES